MPILNSRHAVLIFSASILLLAIGCASQSALKPFTSDSCSCWPEGYDNQKQWEKCCEEHDLAYWAGGSWEERLEADRKLKECVEQAGDTAVAQIMYFGVRAGGTAFLPFPWRWGYGWTHLRGYSPLTRREQKIVDGLKRKAVRKLKEPEK